MNLKINLVTIIIAFFLIGLSACVSKKKYRAEISHLQKDYNGQIQQLDRQLKTADRTVDSLTLQLAEKTGANEALLQTQDKFQARIEELQSEVEKRETLASSQKQESSEVLTQKDTEIAARQAKIEGILEIIAEREFAMQDLSFELANTMRRLDSLGKHHEVEIVDGKVAITLYESLLFQSGGTRVRTGGVEMLGIVAEVLRKHPQFKITVEGHMDNRPVRNYKDQWGFSALRAASVVRILTEEYDLSPSQITVSARGEYSPKASNELPEGRAMNRRIEIIVSPLVDMVLSRIKKGLE